MAKNTGKPGRTTPDQAAPARSRETAPPARSAEAARGDRIAKVLARAGLCSRREAETWIAAGRVAVNGRVLDSPAVVVGPRDRIEVDGKPMPEREQTRLWLYHKPRGLVTTARDPQGRPTVFDALPPDLPRVVTVGRLDINTEGLLLLTNDGGLARILELPATGWLRRYRVRAFGKIDQAALDTLKEGIALDGVLYGPIEAGLERQRGDNAWIMVGLREGKNREIKKVLTHLGLEVNRLIRVSFGPFQLGDLAPGEVREIRGRTLRDQLGARLAREAHADFLTPDDPEWRAERPAVARREDAAAERPRRKPPPRAKEPAPRAKEPAPRAKEPPPRAKEPAKGSRSPGGRTRWEAEAGTARGPKPARATAVRTAPGTRGEGKPDKPRNGGGRPGTSRPGGGRPGGRSDADRRR